MSLKEKTDISDEVRAIVLKRDSYEDTPCCIWCGKPFPNGGAHLHHVQSRGAGGEGKPENLVTLCYEHHALLHNGRSDIQKYCKEYLEELYGTDRIE